MPGDTPTACLHSLVRVEVVPGAASGGMDATRFIAAPGHKGEGHAHCKVRFVPQVVGSVHLRDWQASLDPSTAPNTSRRELTREVLDRNAAPAVST